MMQRASLGVIVSAPAGAILTMSAAALGRQSVFCFMGCHLGCEHEMTWGLGTVAGLSNRWL